jgi:hypothetical protein
MVQSVLRTAPNLVLKASYENSDVGEKIIGYANNLQWTVVQGQKAIFGVDSPFPQEIAQAAGPSYITGTLTLYMPKGSDPVRASLVPPAGFKDDFPRQASSKYLHWRLYDRFSAELVLALNYCKVSQWSVSVTAKQLVMVQLSFEGFMMDYGTA